MSEPLPREYPFIHIYPQHNPRQPVIIKANTEGICVLLNVLVCALVQSNGTTEVFCGDAETYEVVVKLVNTHDELSPLPYQEQQS